VIAFENQVILGDCLEVLRGLPDSTFDSCVMDPPYGLGDEPTVEEILAYLQGADLKTGDFMGKDWDIPSVLVWRELFRVLKPGAHVLSFGGTRTWDLLSLGARAAGFEKRDTIANAHPGLMWVQGQGMPKSTNISKQIDKKKGAKRKVLGPDHARRKRANKGTTSEILPSYDKPREAQAEAVITEPATEEAKTWNGWGTGLKPTWEPIMVFRKPLSEKTLSAQVLKTGTGGLNIDACRVRHSSPEDFEKHKAGVEAIKARGGSMDNSWKNSSDLSGANEVTSAGRWPPNLGFTHSPECRNVGTKQIPGHKGYPHGPGGKTMHYSSSKRSAEVRPNPWAGHADADGTETIDAWECAPGCPAAELDAQSGNRPSTLTGRADPNAQHENPGDNHGKSTFGGGNSRVYADEGGASRYYPQFEGQGPVEVPFLYTGKATKKETSLDGEIKNDHPTKKPLKLMQWLVRLVTPKGGITIDPYCGSGSTLHAAIEEGMKYTGIEKDPHAHKIASKRMEIVEGRARDYQGQRSLFDLAMGGLEDDE